MNTTYPIIKKVYVDRVTKWNPALNNGIFLLLLFPLTTNFFPEFVQFAKYCLTQLNQSCVTSLCSCPSPGIWDWSHCNCWPKCGNQRHQPGSGRANQQFRCCRKRAHQELHGEAVMQFWQWVQFGCLCVSTFVMWMSFPWNCLPCFDSW